VPRRHLGAVSLFDFDASDESCIFENEFTWGSVLTQQLPARVLIRIRREALEQANLLLPADISRGDPRLGPLPDHIAEKGMYLRGVEALHIGPIAASAFSGFILTAFKFGGGYYLSPEVAVDGDAFRVLSEMGAQWTADHDRLMMERHARGEYSLAEVVEASMRLEASLKQRK
jgi:hypothetical protein